VNGELPGRGGVQASVRWQQVGRGGRCAQCKERRELPSRKAMAATTSTGTPTAPAASPPATDVVGPVRLRMWGGGGATSWYAVLALLPLLVVRRRLVGCDPLEGPPRFWQTAPRAPFHLGGFPVP